MVPGGGLAVITAAWFMMVELVPQLKGHRVATVDCLGWGRLDDPYFCITSALLQKAFCS